MKKQSIILWKVTLCLGALGLLGSLTTVAQAQPEANRPATASIEPFADELLRKMSAKLAQTAQFTVTGKRTMDAALAQGAPVMCNITCEISMQRPDRLVARITGDESRRVFCYDGSRVTLLDRTLNVYATFDSAGTIDEMLARLREQYGFLPPLADFLVRDPYAGLTRDVQNVRVQGRESAGGQDCHHLVLTRKDADWELWLTTEDLLPRKFVIIQRNMPGRPRLEAVLAKWDLAPRLATDAFTFTPPKGAEKIEMIPLHRRAGSRTGQTQSQEPVPRDMLFSLPDQALLVSVSGTRYFKVNGQYYKPAIFQGETVYMMVDVE